MDSISAQKPSPKMADLLRPTTLGQWIRMAWARLSGKPIADSVPGIEKEMRLAPDEYDSSLGETQPAIDPGLLEFLKKHITPGMTVFDIGAKAGPMTLFCAGLIGEEGNIIAFESKDRAYERLVANIQLNHLNNVIPVRETVSDTDGFENFPCADGSLVSFESSATPSEECHDNKIPVHRIDTLIAESGWPVPDLVKVDVEGVERRVLSGMSETLRSDRTRILVLEIPEPDIRKSAGSVRDLVEKLEDNGFFCLEIGRDGTLCELDRELETGGPRMLAAMRG